MSLTPADNSNNLAMDVQALGRLRQSARPILQRLLHY